MSRLAYGLCGTAASCLIALGLAATAPVQAADAARGAELHQKHCLGCHDDSVYRRAERRVQSRQALQAQITGCEHAANAKLSRDQIDDLVHYLDSTYYQFK